MPFLIDKLLNSEKSEKKPGSDKAAMSAANAPMSPSCRYAQETLELSPEDFISFRDYIHKKSGLYFTENKMYLVKNRLQSRMNKIGSPSFRDYINLLKFGNDQNEFNALMNVLTTNETSFFRNEPQIQVFADEVLPLLLKQKKRAGDMMIRIWSAGCSTGEEPYTLAMVLKEKVPNLGQYNLEILANDISLHVLEAAARGVYHKLSLRTTPEYYKSKYFTRDAEVYHLSDDIKNMVKFSHINMIDRARMAMIRNIDIIFCRNVSIYFSEEVKKIVTRSFYESLVPGGYYFIGHSESLHGITKAFKLVYFKNGLVYQKD